MGDVLFAVSSHQATTNLLLNRMANRYGLRVQTLQHDDELLPSKYLPCRARMFYVSCAVGAIVSIPHGVHPSLLVVFLSVGWHYLRRPEFMRQLIQSNKTKSLSFHYNWNSNKDIKRDFLEQMGDWFVEDICLTKIMMRMPKMLNLELCCAKEPTIRCHYSDKASLIPCRDSPAFSTGKSFW